MSLRFEPIEQFAAVDEPGAEPLVSARDGGAAIAASSLVVMYGNGGAGKTTAAIDMACAFAAGDSWHGLITPIRPLRIAMIENEGPRPMFRQKLKQKLDGWAGSPIDGRIKLLAEPWARFTFRDTAHIEELAAAVAEMEIDILIVGPVSQIGMEGGGTLDEISEFTRLVKSVEEKAVRQIAVILVHHESKSGQISGAWEAFPDTLIHVQAQGHGRTRLFWQKARWASELHQTTTRLAWAPGDTFTIEEHEPVTEASIADAILAASLELPGGSWSKIRAKVKGNNTEAQAVRDRLIRDGLVVNRPAREGTFNLWHHEDPAAIRSELGTGPERLPFPLTQEDAEPSRSPVPDVSRNGERNGTAYDAPATFTARTAVVSLRTAATVAEGLDGEWPGLGAGIRRAAFRLDYLIGRVEDTL